MKSILSLSILLSALLFSACGSGHEGSEKQLRQDLDAFCDEYFSWRFPDAVKFCTDSSRLWLEYAASNVHDADIEALRQMEEGTSHEIKSIDFIGDSTATATVLVKNVLTMDTIGAASHIRPEATYTLRLKYEKENWKVSLSELPRQE